MSAPSPLESGAAAGGAVGGAAGGGGRRVLELGAEIPSRKARTFSESSCRFIVALLSRSMLQTSQSTGKAGKRSKDGAGWS